MQFMHSHQVTPSGCAACGQQAQPDLSAASSASPPDPLARKARDEQGLAPSRLQADLQAPAQR